MKNKFTYYSICALVFACFFLLSNVIVSSQGFYKKRSSRPNGKGKKGKVEFKKNIVWLEGLGSSQIVSVKYERIFMFGSFFSARVDAGITPFVVDEKYNFIVGRSITPITGLGFYFHVVPFPIRIGVGCSVLHDIYFQGIPETIKPDTATGNTESYDKLTYRARVMPYAVIEATIKDRWTLRAGYTPIIDPPNQYQKDLYFTHWATFGVGYKFGR